MLIARRWYGLLPFGLALMGAAASLLAQGGAPKAPPATLVSAVLVEERDVVPEQEFVGTVMPLKKAVIGSAVDGRVDQFDINEGDYVEDKGVLAVLLQETITKELEAAQAELVQRQEELRELENGSRPEEINQAKARMGAAKARMDYSKIRLQRLESLFQQGRAASPEEVDEATATSEEAHNAFIEATAAYNLILEGPRDEDKAQAQARIEMQKAIVDKLADQKRKHNIISRFNGYVTAEHTEVGAWVNRGDPVAEVVYLDEVDVEVHVVENHVPFIDVGYKTKVTLAALPGRSFEGAVALVVPQADARTRTFPVKVRVVNEKKNGSPVLKSGMLARVDLPVGQAQHGIAIPKGALVLDGQRKSVWVVDPKTVKPLDEGGEAYLTGMATSIPVKTGAEDGDWVLVESLTQAPIQKGQYVISVGNERIFSPAVKWRAPGAKSSAKAR